MNILLLAANLGSASASLICMIISLILLFIAAFVVGEVGGGTPWRPHVSFLAAGIFFFVLSVALSG